MEIIKYTLGLIIPISSCECRDGGYYCLGLGGAAYFPEDYMEFHGCIMYERMVFVTRLLVLFFICMFVLYYFRKAVQCKIIHH